MSKLLKVSEARVLARILVCILISIPLLYAGAFAHAQTVDDVLQTTKSDSPDPVEEGDDLTYRVTVTNVHEVLESDGNLTDALPTSASFANVTWTADADSASCGHSGQPTGGTVTCTFTNLDPNGGELLVTLTVVPTQEGIITNSVTATSTTPPDAELTPENNSANTTTTVVADEEPARLSVDKSDSPDPVGQGEELDYLVTVTNSGLGGFAGEVQVTDSLPDSVEFVTVTWSGGAPGVCGYDPDSHQVTCTFFGFQTNDQVRITITVLPFEQGVITNEVTASSERPENTPGDNTAFETTTVQEGESDIGVTKTDSPDPVARGGTLVYSITVTAVSGFADTVRVTDTLPASFDFESVEWTDSGSCAYNSGSHTVTCTFDDMLEGDVARVTITGMPTQSGVITNTVVATSTSEVSPTTSSNNTDTETTTVSASAAANLDTRKSDSPDPVGQGGVLTYLVTLTNTGGFASDVFVTDTLPSSADFLTLDWVGPGTCSYNSGPHTVTCAFSNMQQGSRATITVTVSPQESGTITNTVTSTTSDEPAGTMGNNGDTEATDVTPAPILNVEKTDSPDPVFVGEDLTYRITVTNSGGGTAELRVTDTLPSQVIFESANWFGPSPNDCDYDEPNHRVVCVFSNFSSSSVASLTITVVPQTNGTITNIVEANASGAPNAVSDSETTTVFASERDQRGDRVDVFVRGGDGALWHRFFNGATWSPYESLGGFIQGDPSAVSWDSGRIDVFARGGDNALWHMSWNGTSWSAWESLGGVITSGPDAASWGPNRLDVFVRGGDNALWHMSWNGTSWSAWESLGGVITTDPTGVSWSANRVDVFVIGGDNSLWHKWWDGSSWSGYEPLGGFFTSAPDAASWAPNRLDAFARGGDNAMWHISWNGSAWSNFESLGGAFTSAPGAVSAANDTVDVFGRGTDNALWWIHWNGGSWSGWSSLNGILTAGPDASSWSNPAG